MSKEEKSDDLNMDNSNEIAEDGVQTADNGEQGVDDSDDESCTGGYIESSYPWNQAYDTDEFDMNEYLINYNDLFKDEAPTLFRDSLIQQTISCMIGKFKPNALLVGPAGVGKTKIVEDIARRIANNDPLIPKNLRDYTIWELPLSNIVSGSGLVGDVERKTKAVLEYAQNPDNKVILFIDEIHMLAEGNQTYDKIAQLMKPALARGNMKVIGATTLQESQCLLNDPAFNRRFTRLIVDELSKEQTVEILIHMADEMVRHYNHIIDLDAQVLREVVNVADHYKTIGSHRPDNAIALLDRTMADAVLQEMLSGNKGKSQKKHTPKLLTEEQMKKTAMKLMTGNNEKVETDMALLKKNLEVIKGQDEILEYLIDVFERDNLNLFPRKVPLSILFAGNSGVGKTEIAKIISRTLTGMEPIILNMTEFSNSSALNRIIGAPSGFVGSEPKAELPFDILESNPYQVILLDEFEKADIAVQRLFISAFDEGYIKTSKGKCVDFSKAIMIATTNAGHTTRGRAMGFNATQKNFKTATISELSKFFDVELLNRFTGVLNFGPITEEIFVEILKDTYRRMVEEIHANRKDIMLSAELAENAVKELKDKYYEEEFGARPVRLAVQKYIEDLVLNRR